MRACAGEQESGSWTMRCACLLRVVGTRRAHRPRGDMWSPRAVHSRLVQRRADLERQHTDELNLKTEHELDALSEEECLEEEPVRAQASPG